MGDICSICVKKQNGKEEKYREPEQDPKNRNGITVATNQGGTLEKEDPTTDKGKSTSAGTSVPGPSNDKKSSDEKSDDGKGTGKSASAGTSVPGPSNDKKSSDEKSDDGKGTGKSASAGTSVPGPSNDKKSSDEKSDDGKGTGKSASAGTSVPGPSNDKKSSDEKSDDGKGTSQTSKDKKVKGKKEKRKADSSDTLDSSTDTDSSDSDDMGYQKSSRKTYKKKHGGTTKNGVGDVNFGKGAKLKNVTINNNSTPNPTKTEGKTRYEPYNANTWRKSMAKGNFVYLPWASKGRVEGLDVSNLKVNAGKMICKIQYPGGSASGFRVGCQNRNLLCTANHVLEKIMDAATSVMGPSRLERERILEKADVWCIFNYVIDEANMTEADKFYFKPIVHFTDLETDVAILELKDNQYGTAMPPPFTRFVMPQANKPFYLIGHPNGGKKMSCLSENLIDMTSSVTSNHITTVRRWCLEHGGLQCEPDRDHQLDNPARWLFHVDENFTKGASGCPGLVINPTHTISVVTILLRGYPDWFYDENIPLQTKALLPKGYRVEQGANMQYVYQNMRDINSALCTEIFNVQA